MITPGYLQKLAEYNRWMNESIYGSCETLSDADRRKDCGAFFGSIHATLNHVLWADQAWLHRLAGLPKPKAATIPDSLTQYETFEELKAERVAFDQVIADWTAGISAADLEGDLTWYSASMGKEMTTPRWVLMVHVFQHQIHHRGQIHCLLTQFGVETPVTDIPMMP